MGPGNEHSSPPSSPDFALREQELLAAHRTRRVPRYRSLVMHWLGRALRMPRRSMVAPLPTVMPGQVGISFAGHATVLIRYADRHIVCDPMLGNWVGGIKRAVMPGLSAADLHDVDLILISHGHADHLHRPTLARLPRSATVVVPPRTAHRVSDLGFARVVEISPGQSIQDHGVDIATAAVQHDAGPGYHALSYVIRGHGPSVYFCGDSGYFAGFGEIGRRYRPDIAILPIGGYAPLAFRKRHMSPLDALHALEDLGARIMIPIHHGAFALSYEELEEPGRWLGELVRERKLEHFVVELEPGESRVFVPPRPDEADGRDKARTGEAPGENGESDESSPPPGSDRAMAKDPRHAVLSPMPPRIFAPQPLPALRVDMHMQGHMRSWIGPDLSELAAGHGADLDLIIDVDLDGLAEHPAEPMTEHGAEPLAAFT